jgi:type I restriction enzyme M protein
VLPKDYARPGLDKQRLGQIINLVSDIALGAPADRAKDTLGRVYEYFLARSPAPRARRAASSTRRPAWCGCWSRCSRRTRAGSTTPAAARAACSCSSEKFIEAHSGKLGDISIYGQESNYTTWRLAKMNLAIRGIDAQIGHGDTFHNDCHPDLKADYVLANPPFNDSDWRGELLKDDKRWVYGVPPAGNANYAWVQHFIHHLAPTAWPASCWPTARCRRTSRARGRSARRSSRPIWWTAWWRMPGQLFYSTQIPVCLWFLAAQQASLLEGPGVRGSATGVAKRCSSTRARWARWWTARTAS